MGYPKDINPISYFFDLNKKIALCLMFKRACSIFDNFVSERCQCQHDCQAKCQSGNESQSELCYVSYYQHRDRHRYQTEYGCQDGIAFCVFHSDPSPTFSFMAIL